MPCASASSESAGPGKKPLPTPIGTRRSASGRPPPRPRRRSARSGFDWRENSASARSARWGKGPDPSSDPSLSQCPGSRYSEANPQHVEQSERTHKQDPESQLVYEPVKVHVHEAVAFRERRRLRGGGRLVDHLVSELIARAEERRIAHQIGTRVDGRLQFWREGPLPGLFEQEHHGQ